MFVALAIGLALSGAPKYQLDFEVERIVFEPSEQVFSRYLHRVEADPAKKVKRLTITDSSGTKSIYVEGPSGLSAEQVDASGKRTSLDMTGLNQLSEMSKKPEAMPSFESKQKVEKKFKTIAGIRCQKVTESTNLGGYKSETVEWRPIDPKLAKAVFHLERYWYNIAEDGTRKLWQCETTSKVTLGPLFKKR